MESRKWGLRNQIIILTLAMLTQFCKTETLTHFTESTKCQINFQLQEGTQSTFQQPNHQLQFKKCIRKVCQSYYINGMCRSQQEFNLEEWKCFQQCCGSSQFDFLSCEDYNKVYQQREKNSLSILITALSISITGLLMAAIIFAVKILKCCPKKEQQADKNQSDEANSQKNSILPSWKNCQFDTSYECYECKKQGAFVMLPCGKIYHLHCLNTGQWSCSHCSVPISKIKFYCIICLKCSIMLKVQSSEMIWERVTEAYSWHPHRCYQYLEEELGIETDRKLTEATNVSP